MVATTLDNRSFEFNYGDIIVSDVPGTYLIPYSFTRRTFTSVLVQPGTVVTEFVFNETGLPDVFTKIIRSNTIKSSMGQVEKLSLEKMLEDLEIPDIKNIFPQQDRVNLNQEEIAFDIEDVINKYTKALLLIQYLEKIIENVFTPSKPNFATKLEEQYAQYLVKHSPTYTEQVAPQPKTTGKIRRSAQPTKIDPIETAPAFQSFADFTGKD